MTDKAPTYDMPQRRVLTIASVHFTGRIATVVLSDGSELQDLTSVSSKATTADGVGTVQIEAVMRQPKP